MSAGNGSLLLVDGADVDGAYSPTLRKRSIVSGFGGCAEVLLVIVYCRMVTVV